MSLLKARAPPFSPEEVKKRIYFSLLIDIYLQITYDETSINLKKLSRYA